jgi:hypothetical protein
MEWNFFDPVRIQQEKLVNAGEGMDDLETDVWQCKKKNKPPVIQDISSILPMVANVG